MVKDVLQRIKLIFIVLILPYATSFSAAPSNFSLAKKVAFELFRPHQVTLYCACNYDSEKKVDLNSCNMNNASPIERANRIEWEHMMPAEQLGRSHQCWKEKICVHATTGKPYRGRKCCEKIDPVFRQKESDLYNLWPAVGAVNQARSNYRFGILHNKRGYYGCEFEADNALKIAEPPDRAKGVVARANLFMSEKYQIELDKDQRELFQKWNKQFPPQPWELQWATEVAKIVGYKNPYIKIEKEA